MSGLCHGNRSEDIGESDLKTKARGGNRDLYTLLTQPTSPVPVMAELTAVNIISIHAQFAEQGERSRSDQLGAEGMSRLAIFVEAVQMDSLHCRNRHGKPVTVVNFAQIRTVTCPIPFLSIDYSTTLALSAVMVVEVDGYGSGRIHRPILPYPLTKRSSVCFRLIPSLPQGQCSNFQLDEPGPGWELCAELTGDPASVRLPSCTLLKSPQQETWYETFVRHYPCLRSHRRQYCISSRSPLTVTDVETPLATTTLYETYQRHS